MSMTLIGSQLGITSATQPKRMPNPNILQLLGDAESFLKPSVSLLDT